MVDGLCLHGTYILDKAQQIEKEICNVREWDGDEWGGHCYVCFIRKHRMWRGGCFT